MCKSQQNQLCGEVLKYLKYGEVLKYLIKDVKTTKMATQKEINKQVLVKTALENHSRRLKRLRTLQVQRRYNLPLLERLDPDKNESHQYNVRYNQVNGSQIRMNGRYNN